YLYHTTSPNNRLIKSGQLWQGVPGKTIFKLPAASITGGTGGQDDIILRNSAPGSGNTDITIYGLTFDGNARGNPGAVVNAAALVRFDKVHTLHIEDCQFIDSKTQALNVVDSDDIFTVNNSFYRIAQGYCSITADKPCSVDGDCGAETCVAPTGDATTFMGTRHAYIGENVIMNVSEGVFCQQDSSTSAVNVDCSMIGNTVLSDVVGAASCIASGIPFTCC